MNEPFVPIEDVAKHFSVSVSTVRAWVSQKQIPEDNYVRVGKNHRFGLLDVTEALTKTLSSRSEETVGEDLLNELDEYL